MDPWTPGTETGVSGYVSIADIAKLLVGIQVLAIGVRGVMLAAVLFGVVTGQDDASLVLGGFGAIGLLGIALFGMPVWIYVHWRAASNLEVLGVELQNPPASHAYWWFVPLANLVMPYRAMAELWLGSTRTGGPEDDERSMSPSVMSAWWTCWILGNVANNIAFRFPGTVLGVATEVVGLALSIGAAVYYVSFIRQIAAGQDHWVARTPR